MTAKSILSVVNSKENKVPENSKLYLKDGCDGAGSIPKLKSVKSVNDAETIFQYGIIPLKLVTKNEDGVEVVKWENTVMNSPSTFRSVYTIREKETNDDLLKLVVKKTDQARESLNRNGIDLLFDDNNVHVEIDIKDTMKDLKFKKKISGLGGADCLLCKSKQKDWTNQEAIQNKESFRINRSAIDTRSIFNSVVDGDGNIRTKPYDFDVRSGITHEPITVSDQHSIT